MTKLIVSTILVVGLAISCAPKTYPPDLSRVYNVNQLVNTIGLIQNSAIGLQANNQLSVSDTRIVVNFTVTALKLIKDAPLNWKQKVLNALTDLKESGILPSILDKFRPAMLLIEKIIWELK